MYADYAYYEAEYLLGKEPVIPDDTFPFWEKKARLEIDLATFDRIPTLEQIPDVVKDCTCEVAELLYETDKLTQDNLKNGVAGAMTSYSNDGQSGSYDVSQSVYTAEGSQKETARIIRKYLLNTGLMYKGVYEHEP